jgi:predicted alpha/beta superfamily hydrolase
MHDGQNLFDDATSYSGEWGVDDYLDSLGMNANDCIVVAVDNGGLRRMNEYSPYDFDLGTRGASPHTNKGEGNEYVDFLVKTLKPYIDKNYRTAKNKANTAIAGSSMGGLISLYAVLKYPRVFGAAGIFSPAFWIAPQIFADINTKGKKVHARIYFYAGKLEGENMVPDMLRAYEGLSKVSRSKLQAVIRDDGKHNEATWRREFPLFYEWINKK